VILQHSEHHYKGKQQSEAEKYINWMDIAWCLPRTGILWF